MAARDNEVGRYFASVAPYWRSIYDDDTVYAVIHQDRAERALGWIREIDLPIGASVLDVGCGAGVLSVALAERGFAVSAADIVPEMVDSARRLAEARGVDGRMRAMVADVRDLPLADGAYSLVVGLGVLPWLDDPRDALKEMARVLAPGGSLLVNVDNLYRLHYLLDPRRTPILAPVRSAARSALRRIGRISAERRSTLAHLRAPSRLDADLRAAGLQKLRGETFGFGPFTFWNRQVFSDEVARQLYRRLQRLADDGWPILDALGSQYLVLARKGGTSVARAHT